MVLRLLISVVQMVSNQTTPKGPDEYFRWARPYVTPCHVNLPLRIGLWGQLDDVFSVSERNRPPATRNR